MAKEHKHKHRKHHKKERVILNPALELPVKHGETTVRALDDEKRWCFFCCLEKTAAHAEIVAGQTSTAPVDNRVVAEAPPEILKLFEPLKAPSKEILQQETIAVPPANTIENATVGYHSIVLTHTT